MAEGTVELAEALFAVLQAIDELIADEGNAGLKGTNAARAMEPHLRRAHEIVNGLRR